MSVTIDHAKLLNQLQEWGQELGFSQIAIAPVDLSTAEPGLSNWLAQGFHGSMQYIAKHGLNRARPAQLVPGTVSVITARMNYLPKDTSNDWAEQEKRRLSNGDQAVISIYARGRDYHKVMRQRLEKLAHLLQVEVGELGYRVFTDSAPVLEAELAQRSGQGWRGKHTLILNRDAGSMFFLGEIYIDLLLPATAPVQDHCGSCQSCIDVCPTQAILAPGLLDARRCISYLTIEHKESIPIEFRSLMGNRIYGCDDCQLICPWNKYAQRSELTDFDTRHGLQSAQLLSLWSWSASEFEERMQGSAIRRIGFEQWLRNLAVAMGNALRACDEATAKKLLDALDQRMHQHGELVDEHIAWAIEQSHFLSDNPPLASVKTLSLCSDSLMKPTAKPQNPNFSSGPCAKRPGYRVDALQLDTLGRSHRSTLGKEVLARACSETARLLRLPKGYRVGIVPASDTGAVEMAMWSMLGERGVDVLSWESFSAGWVTDIVGQLKLPHVQHHQAPYGKISDLVQVNFDNDVVFVWNGTTSGVKVPNGDWIPNNRQGLTICDATSAVFAMDMPWEKLDVVTYSWQKVLGGEGAHGMLILSPRAVERIENYNPPWPMPKIFRMKSGNTINEGIFRGETINTPSMLCVADYLDALQWADGIGGLSALVKRCQSNFNVIDRFVSTNDWISFLAVDPATRSSTSVCLLLKLDDVQVKKMVQLLEDESVAYDIASYKDAPSGLRIWCGATVETSDLQALMPWLTWAYLKVKNLN